MLWDLESVIENGVGEVPQELIDSELCETYGWSWQQLQDTPWHFRQVCFQIQLMKRAKQRQDNERANNPGMQVISHA